MLRCSLSLGACLILCAAGQAIHAQQLPVGNYAGYYAQTASTLGHISAHAPCGDPACSDCGACDAACGCRLGCGSGGYCREPGECLAVIDAWLCSPCDMVQHHAYFPPLHGYYYFRPYNINHIAKQQQFVGRWGGNHNNPYENEIFQRVYHAYESDQQKQQGETGDPFRDDPPEEIEPGPPPFEFDDEI